MLLLAVLLLGCGDDDGPTKDPGDPPRDAALAGDAAQNSACSNLCQCVQNNCPADHGSCESTCSTLSAAAVSCRLQHCGYASSNPEGHCPHVRGDSDPQYETPTECIGP